MKIAGISFSRAYLQMWWFPAMVVVVILIGSMSIMIPQIGSLIEKDALLKSQRASLVKARAKLDQVSQLDDQQVGWLATITSQALPNKKPYYEVLQVVQNLALQTGVVVGDLDLDPGLLATQSAKNQKQGYTTLSTTLRVRGTTQQVTQFIDRLHRSLPLIGMTEVSISPGSKDGGDLRQATLDIDIYYTTDTVTKQNDITTPLSVLTPEMQTVFSTLQSYSIPVAPTASAGGMLNFNRTDVFSF